MTNREKVWRGGRPNSGVSNLAHTKRKIPNKYKEDRKKYISNRHTQSKEREMCFVSHFIYIIFYQLKGLILTPWTEYVLNKSKNK